MNSEINEMLEENSLISWCQLLMTVPSHEEHPFLAKHIAHQTINHK